MQRRRVFCNLLGHDRGVENRIFVVSMVALRITKFSLDQVEAQILEHYEHENRVQNTKENDRDSLIVANLSDFLLLRVSICLKDSVLKRCCHWNVINNCAN